MERQVYDIIVAGGGLAGVAAAISAAREGAKVLLVERYGFLGGMATAGLVNPFMGYCLREGSREHPDKMINKGIFKLILDRLSELGGLHANRSTFNEEIMKLVLDRLVKEYGIEIVFHSFVSEVEIKDDKIVSITAVSKSGYTKYTASFFIDATGDADLSALAGCPYEMGREEDGLCQPMTLCFRLANVDPDWFKDRNARELMQEKFRELKNKGELKNPRDYVLFFPHMVEDVLHLNSTRIYCRCPVDVNDLTRAEMEAREQVFELYRFFKDNIPGFENCQLLMSAPQTGIRESRRIVGDYVLTTDDLLNAVKFEDSIARGNYPVDIHSPTSEGTVIMDIPDNDYYTIPYRSLIPKGINNLIVTGRPISATHAAHAAIRVMPITTCMGEAAGIAAAVALKHGTSFRKVDVAEIQSYLDKHGALY